MTNNPYIFDQLMRVGGIKRVIRRIAQFLHNRKKINKRRILIVGQKDVNGLGRDQSFEGKFVGRENGE